MNMKNILNINAFAHRSGVLAATRLGLAFTVLMLGQGLAQAAAPDTTVSGTTALANVPLGNARTSVIKPNIMLLVDSSRSMAFTHMPDGLENPGENRMGIGYRSSRCNSLYFDPGKTYSLPKDYAGAALPTPLWPKAAYNYYLPSQVSLSGTNAAGTAVLGSASVDLSANFQAYDRTSRLRNVSSAAASDTPQKAYYYEYTGSVPLTPALCNELEPTGLANQAVQVNSATANANWQRRLVENGSPALQKSFAIWYQYYRTRMLLIKSGVGLAFNGLTDGYRVGLVTMAPTKTDGGPVDPSQYIPIADFKGGDTYQKQAWYQKLNSLEPIATGSPAREGLARVGLHYADRTKLTGTTSTNRSTADIVAGMQDPNQGSCQPNFTIMTTDGYWGGSSADEKFGPIGMDGKNVGNQDGDLSNPNSPRPMWDGMNTGRRTTIDAKNQYNWYACPGIWVSKLSTQVSRSTSQTQRTTTQQLQRTTQLNERTSQINEATSRIAQSTTQILASTSQIKSHTEQRLQSTSQSAVSTQQMLESTLQNSVSTAQIIKATSRTTQSTAQRLESTLQTTQRTSQTFLATSQILRTTTFISSGSATLRKTTTQNTQSTKQDTASTSQRVRYTSQQRIRTDQNQAKTTQIKKSTKQILVSTSQLQKKTVQNNATTTQIKRSTSQLTETTSQLQLRTSQRREFTAQINRSTTQLLRRTTQERANYSQNRIATSQLNQFTQWTDRSTSRTTRSTSQLFRVTTESYTPVETCSTGPGVSCTTETTGPTGTTFAGCVAQSPNSGNDYLRVTCDTVTTGPTRVESCTNATTANSGNNWTTTTCAFNQVSGNTPVQTCTPVNASAGNNWTATKCTTVTTGPSFVLACSPVAASSSNSWTATTCPTPTTSSEGVSSCTPVAASSRPDFRSTTCTTSTTGPTAVGTCSAESASSSNSWTTSTCEPVTTGPTPVTACTPSAADGSNSQTTTTCNTVSNGPTPVSSCTPAAADASNTYTSKTCDTITTGPTGVQTCNATAASNANSWTATTCTNFPTGPTGVQTCTNAAANAGNSWKSTTCNTVTSGPTAIGACTPAAASGSNLWVATTCDTTTVGPTPVASCTNTAASGSNSYVATTCSVVSPPATGVETCTNEAASSTNNYVATTCAPVNTGPLGASACTPSAGNAGNGWVTTTCGNGDTPATPVASCSAITGNAGNSWTSTICETTVVPYTSVMSCTPAAPSSTNSYTRTECKVNTTGPTPTGSCTPIAASSTNDFVATSCPVTNGGPTGTSSCSPISASSTNSWTATTCDVLLTGPTAVDTCAIQNPSGTNQYLQRTCAVVTSGPTPIASCTPVTATPGNQWVDTTCAVVTVGPTVGACSPSSATGANNWTTTTCEVVNSTPSNVPACVPEDPSAANGYVGRYCATSTVGPIAVAACTPQTASSSNNWVGITCQTPTTGPDPVASCTASGPTAGNSYVTTTCDTQTTGPTFVDSSTCTSIAPNAGNGYKTTTCTTATTPATGVQTCTPVVASASNDWKTTNCTNANTGPTGVASCTPITAAAGNSWKATTCNTVTTGPAPDASCTPATTGTSTNNWTRTTCNTIRSGPTFVASCTAEAASAANDYIATTCAENKTGPTGVQTCVAVSPSNANDYKETTCTNAVTGPTFIASCANIAPGNGNGWKTTTCNTATTGPTAVATCTNITAGNGNDWKTTSCVDNNSAPVPAPSCTNTAADASNNYVKTVCQTDTTVPTGVQSCVNEAASPANQYKSTTCTTNNTGPTGVASCTAAVGGTGNQWKTTTCNTTTTGPTPVASCTPAATANLGNDWTTRTCPTNNTGPTPVASCAAVTPAAGNNFIGVTCATAVTPEVGVEACVASSPSAGNAYVETFCRTATVQNWVTSCAATPPGAGNGWLGTACNTTLTGPTPVASCNASTGGNALITTCNTLTVGPAIVPAADCTAAAATAGNDFTSVTCEAKEGSKAGFITTLKVTESKVSGSTSTVNVRDPAATVSTVQYLDNICHAPNAVLPDLPLDGTPAIGMNPLPSSVSDTTNGVAFTCDDSKGWPCVNTIPGNEGGSTDSLADVAQYFYVTDLRPGTDYGTNNIKGPPVAGTQVEDDRARYQHMTTFVVGLGVSGNVGYQENYREGVAGDYRDIKEGNIKPSTGEPANWPIWPDPAVDYSDPLNYNNARSIDDFWHTAVNGRGRYFSASDSGTVVAGIKSALGSIGALGGAASAASTSTLELTTGDSTAFAASYKTEEWTGDLVAVKLNPLTGDATTTPVWTRTAAASLGSRTNAACDNRKIFYYNAAEVSTKLAPFTWNTAVCGETTTTTGLDSTLQGYFGSTAVSKLSQYLEMTESAPDQRSAAAGANLVNFLRGHRGNEGFVAGDAVKLFRKRESIMGDIVGSQPQYVKPPSRSYLDDGYDAFKKSSVKDRKSVVYTGANDGMLHAFDASNGEELWAYVPTPVMPTLYKLADAEYKIRHAFFVDGTPTIGDVSDSKGTTDPADDEWKTILVGGLGAGGKDDVAENSNTGFYALDVTNPDAPKALWEFNKSSSCYAAGSVEFTDCHLGLSFGRPILTKRAVDNKWVVLLSSGYNNVGGTEPGNGRGFLYVLDAMTGRILEKVEAASPDVTIFTGNASTPSGLRNLNNFVVNSNTDNKTLRTYGTDMLGNVWRFNMATSPTTATLLGTTKDKDGNAQPITTRPEIAEVDGSTIVMVGTGKLLAITDLVVDSDAQVQSVYSFKDADYTADGLRQQLRPLKLTTQGTGADRTRTVSCDGAESLCTGTAGWVIDLTDVGERINVDMRVTSGTLVFASNIPDSAQCSAGGSSLLNYVDLISGRAVGGDPNGVVSVHLSSSLNVGIGLIKTSDGRIRAIGRGSDGELVVKDVPIANPPSPGKRVSWREITGVGQ